jgi:hypothetical protein
METAELTIRIPRSWLFTLSSMAECVDYPSMNAMMIELLYMEFDLPHEDWMVGTIDEWWTLI